MIGIISYNESICIVLEMSQPDQSGAIIVWCIIIIDDIMDVISNHIKEEKNM